MVTVVFVPNEVPKILWNLLFDLYLLVCKIFVDTCIVPPINHLFILQERVDDITVVFPKRTNECDSWDIVGDVTSFDGVAKVKHLFQNLLAAKTVTHKINLGWLFKSILRPISCGQDLLLKSHVIIDHLLEAWTKN